MFTVKHRDTDGIETIYEAKKVSVIRRGEHFEDGIYLDPELLEDHGQPSPSDPMATRRLLAAKEVILFGSDKTATASARIGGKVWVMNDAGSTVSTYDL